jgi:hypothetical protein
MSIQATPVELQSSLQSIIEKMQAIQKQISSGSQPASIHELDTLTELGKQYTKVVERLQRPP